MEEIIERIINNVEEDGKNNNLNEDEINENIKHVIHNINNDEIKNNIPLRVCKKCNEVKTLQDNFKTTSRRLREDIVELIIYKSHICKKCMKEKNKEYMKNYHKIHYKPKKINNIEN